MGVVLRVKRGISTLAAFGCDDGVRQFGWHISVIGPRPQVAAARKDRTQNTDTGDADHRASGMQGIGKSRIKLGGRS
jgi:hypothetical protein